MSEPSATHCLPTPHPGASVLNPFCECSSDLHRTERERCSPEAGRGSDKKKGRYETHQRHLRAEGDGAPCHGGSAAALARCGDLHGCAGPDDPQGEKIHRRKNGDPGGRQPERQQPDGAGHAGLSPAQHRTLPRGTALQLDQRAPPLNPGWPYLCHPMQHPFLAKVLVEVLCCFQACLKPKDGIPEKSFLYGEIPSAAHQACFGLIHASWVSLSPDFLAFRSAVSTHCLVAMLADGVFSLPSMLPLVVSTLQKALRDLLCPAMDMVLDLVNAKFATMMYAIPLGNAGMLQYALLNPPTVTEAFIQLELKTILRSKEGEEVALPTDLPPLTSFPPKREATTQLVLAASFLNAELSVMQASFGLNITNGMVLGLLPLVTTMLGALIPEISSMLPPSRPVVIEMQEAQPPLVTITPEKSTVHLYSTAEFWASTPGSAPESLFVLDVHSELGVRFAVAEERLQFSLMLHSLSQVAVVNSSIGAFNVLSLRGALADIIHVAYVPSINRALRGGVPLPPLLGAPYQHVELRQMQDGLVLDVPVAEH
ncbi:BPI fold-containing family B member 6-like isoform X2 [Numida meleagris]|uniref:BPI fold-containing family B member 6-like isoform X2 n=1 Tax=Numida meleagris TaxID=8996 RepID=UPI000B3E164F|nr:BPI fold-containing family B member 6-like isoform X2 [Numida meleagris]